MKNGVLRKTTDEFAERKGGGGGWGKRVGERKCLSSAISLFFLVN